MAATVDCPRCGKLTNPALGYCLHCGSAMGAAPAEAAASSAGGNTGEGLVCPNCSTGLADGAMICTACNTNLLTGQRMGTSEGGAGTAKRRGGRRAVLIAVGVLGTILAAVVCFLFVARQGM